ncbi:NrfD/PsrC family molybdoenzyme membrane anchor subunit [Caenispirillum bisanense]|uniref:Tetrathionate reductase subunit C n=1 Tax=Caenispirillum bisanense TaxID=414052 RepID=A0A286G601_9PROT|nr:NrfD/PsrC family molybdoenzyme membrane anchor subunit [Caenispirillum bisanense]SOD90971.1 tetrathionate reductase subunit C [Caenispirillum bisanense]
MTTTPDIIETVNVARHVAWLPWAVSYFFLIGVSVAGAFLSLPAFLAGRPGCERMGRMAVLTMLSCALVAPVALLADLHQPGRFWHFYAHLTPWSWMSWGALLLPVYVGLAVVYGWLVMRPGLQRGGTLARLLALGTGDLSGLVRPVAAVTALAAAGIVVYTGMEVMVVRARPLWHTPTLPVMFLFTALTGAAGMALVLNRVVAGFEAAAERRLFRALALFSALVLLNGAVWLGLGLTGGGAEADAVASLSGSGPWLAVAGWAGATALLLLVLGLVAPAGFGWAAGLIALHSAWMFRWTVFIGGQTVPKTGAGFYDYHLPLGSEGLAGIVGVFGLWVAVVAILTLVAPWHAQGTAAIRSGDAGRRAAPPAAAE